MRAQKADHDFVVIGNGVDRDLIEMKTLNEIFQGQKTYWENGTPVILVLHSAKSSLIQKTADLFYNGSVKNLQKFWLSLVFQGRVNPPKYFLNEQEIIEYVLSNKGAIALIYETEINQEGLGISLTK